MIKAICLSVLFSFISSTGLAEVPSGSLIYDGEADVKFDVCFDELENSNCLSSDIKSWVPGGSDFAFKAKVVGALIPAGTVLFKGPNYRVSNYVNTSGKKLNVKMTYQLGRGEIVFSRESGCYDLSKRAIYLSWELNQNGVVTKKGKFEPIRRYGNRIVSFNLTIIVENFDPSLGSAEFKIRTDTDLFDNTTCSGEVNFGGYFRNPCTEDGLELHWKDCILKSKVARGGLLTIIGY